MVVKVVKVGCKSCISCKSLGDLQSFAREWNNGQTVDIIRNGKNVSGEVCRG